MDKTKRYLSVAFVVVLAIVIVVSLIGMILLKKKPVILQGQIEATEIRISGKLPGRIDTFLVKEGQNVRQGDTLVVINSPEALAKYQQVNAMENIAKYQHQKVDEGTRKQIIASLQQLWNKSKSDLQLAKITYDRVNALYKDSVVTSQRKDEVEAMYKAAEAAERAAYSQYQMAVDGAQIQDKESARSLVTAAQGTVEEVAALLQDARLTAPESGQISAIFPKRGELVGAGMPIMNLVVLDDVHVVLNVREDRLPLFRMGGTFVADVPAIDQKDIEFKINYISPLGSFATWKSTKQTGSYDRFRYEYDTTPMTLVSKTNITKQQATNQAVAKAVAWSIIGSVNWIGTVAALANSIGDAIYGMNQAGTMHAYSSVRTKYKVNVITGNRTVAAQWRIATFKLYNSSGGLEDVRTHTIKTK